MAEYEITKHFSNCGSRNAVRMRVVRVLAEETAGDGSGKAASRYTYYVETLADGKRIYLRRPAFLHNGFDFAVCVENMNFSTPPEHKRNRPAHKDIVADLEAKRQKDLALYRELYRLMEQVFLCKDVPDEEMLSLPAWVGYTPDLLLKTLKWLFIEQDIRYWNYSGREMLWSAIPKP